MALADLKLCRAQEYGVVFETGKPVRFRFVRNTERAPYFGARFQQDIEPSGCYLLHNPDPGDLPPRWARGEIAFENPLVLRLTTNDDIYGPNGWKARLARVFKAKRERLTHKLRHAGFDGIVTCDSDNSTREIVDLRATSCRRRP